MRPPSLRLSTALHQMYLVLSCPLTSEQWYTDLFLHTIVGMPGNTQFTRFHTCVRLPLSSPKLTTLYVLRSVDPIESDANGVETPSGIPPRMKNAEQRPSENNWDTRERRVTHNSRRDPPMPSKAPAARVASWFSSKSLQTRSWWSHMIQTKNTGKITYLGGIFTLVHAAVRLRRHLKVYKKARHPVREPIESLDMIATTLDANHCCNVAATRMLKIKNML